MLTRAGLAEKDRIVSLRARAFREAESLIRKPSLHASSKSTSESPHAFASLRPSPIRSLRSPSRRKDGSDETWDSVVDRSKARIQSAIDGLHLVLGKLKQDSELSTNTPSTADSERDTNQNRSSNNNTPSSPRPVPEQDSPTDGDRRRRHTSETGTPSVVRSLKWDLDDAATSEADTGSDDEAHLASQKDWRKWRADAERSARLGEELQLLVVDQDGRISQLQAQLAQLQRKADNFDQKQGAWQEERRALEQQARLAQELLATAEQDLTLARDEVEMERRTLRAADESVAEQLRSAAKLKAQVENRLKEEVESWKQQTMLWADTGAQLKNLLSEREQEIEQLRNKVDELQGQLSLAIAAAEDEAAAVQKTAQASQDRARALEQDMMETRAALELAKQALHEEQERQCERESHLQMLLQKQEKERLAAQELRQQALEEADAARERELEQLRADVDRLSRAYSQQQQPRGHGDPETQTPGDTKTRTPRGHGDTCSTSSTSSSMSALARRWAPSELAAAPTLLQETQKKLVSARKQAVAATEKRPTDTEMRPTDSASVEAMEAMREMLVSLARREQHGLHRIAELQQALGASRAHCLQLQQVLRSQARASALRCPPGARAHVATRSAAFVAQACSAEGNLDATPCDDDASKESLQEVAGMEARGRGNWMRGKWLQLSAPDLVCSGVQDGVAADRKDVVRHVGQGGEDLSGQRDERDEGKHLKQRDERKHLKLHGNERQRCLQRETDGRRHWESQACRLRATFAAERSSLLKALRRAESERQHAELQTQELKSLIYCPFEWPLSVPRGVGKWRRSQRKEAFRITSAMTRIIRWVDNVFLMCS